MIVSNTYIVMYLRCVMKIASTLQYIFETVTNFNIFNISRLPTNENHGNTFIALIYTISAQLTANNTSNSW